MNRIMRELLNTAIYLLCVLGAVWLVITFVGQRTEVELSLIHISEPTRRS